MQSKWLRHCALAAVLTGAPIITLAQTATPAPEPTNPAADRAEDNREALGQFDKFLDTHPQVRQDLRSNPSLASDPSYLAQHPDLQTYLNQHPGLDKRITANPEGVLNRETRLNREQNASRDAHALGSFDRLLDQHPEFAKDLRQNPNLINDPNFVSQHPQLQQYLQNHPAVAKHLQQNPKGVLKRERNYEHHE